MKKSGCEVKEIPNMQFQTVETSHAESIIKGLRQSNIRYSAKYNEEKLTLVYSLDDEKRVKEILDKANTDTADFIVRLLSEYDWGSEEDYASLLPEIADIMSVSTSALKNRPSDVQLRLELAYANLWFSDRATIQKVLSAITELGFSAQIELEAAHRQQETSNNTPETRKDIFEEEQRLDNAAAVEREILRQQRENIAQEEQRTGVFTRDSLRREAERIRRQGQQDRQEPIQAERENK